MRHKCNRPDGWAFCTTCEGRIHLPGCTSKRDKHRDCCRERHEMLNSQGITKGIRDSSVGMLEYLDYLDR